VAVFDNERDRRIIGHQDTAGVEEWDAGIGGAEEAIRAEAPRKLSDLGYGAFRFLNRPDETGP
jgi:hypothetical protein